MVALFFRIVGVHILICQLGGKSRRQGLRARLVRRTIRRKQDRAAGKGGRRQGLRAEPVRHHLDAVEEGQRE